MKKFILILFILVISSASTYAKMVDNIYILKNTTGVKNINELLYSKFLLPQKKEDLFFAKEGEFYYVKTYKDGDNSHIYIVCEKENLSTCESNIKNTGFKTYKLDDKDLKRKYSKDFNTFVVSNNIPIKQIGKSGKTNKYNPYSKPLNNTKLEEISMTNENIKITRIKYKAKSQVQDYANAYEYIVVNNNSYPITLKEVGSSDFLTLQKIAKKVVKVDYSVFVPIYGFVRAVRTDIEKNKFTRIMPQNQDIAPNSALRILALSYLQIDPTANFIFEVKNKEYKFVFKKTKE